MHGHTAAVRDSADSAASNDFGMASHSLMMHYAPAKGKCLLHQTTGYLSVMDQIEVGKRLRGAREAAGYDSAAGAAQAMGIPIATYIQHENGTRGFKAATAERYAKRFKTTPEWILYGKGEQSLPEPSEDDLEAMLREALQEVATFEMKIADLPRIVAPILREQLAQYRDHGGVADLWAEKLARDTAARSRAPTRPDEQEESRTA
jgi:transcriptional regulator with XRE-family HTH domain